MRRVEVLTEAQDDVTRGYFFYECQDSGLGSYFRDQIRLDVRQIITILDMRQNPDNIRNILQRR